MQVQRAADLRRQYAMQLIALHVAEQCVLDHHRRVHDAAQRRHARFDRRERIDAPPLHPRCRTAGAATDTPAAANCSQDRVGPGSAGRAAPAQQGKMPRAVTHQPPSRAQAEARQTAGDDIRRIGPWRSAASRRAARRAERTPAQRSRPLCRCGAMPACGERRWRYRRHRMSDAAAAAATRRQTRPSSR